MVGESTPIFVISAQAHQGITEVLRALRAKVTDYRSAQQTPELAEESTDTPTITLGSEQLSDKWDAYYDDADAVWVVTGPKIEKFARRTNFDQFESVNRLRDIMKKMGIYHHLVREGATGDSVVQIGARQFTLLER